MMVETTRKFTVVGITDEVNSCDCCGKMGLKSTFAVRLNETDEIVHYGSTCVTRNTGIKNPASAANAYHKGLVYEAALKLRQTAEYRAREARFAVRNSMKMIPGMEAAEFVREVCKAYDVKRSEIIKQFGLGPFDII